MLIGGRVGLPMEVQEDFQWKSKRMSSGGRIGLPVEVGEGAGGEAFGRVEFGVTL